MEEVRRKQTGTAIRKKRASDSPRAGQVAKKLKVKVKGSPEGTGEGSPASPTPGSVATPSPAKRGPKPGFKRKLTGKKKMVRSGVVVVGHVPAWQMDRLVLCVLGD